MEAVAFQYAPLDHNSTSFRLLHLLPGLSETPIQCHIFNTLVSEWENRYVAGSYVWGQPHSEKDIVLNGKPFKIRENLYAFLSAVRICLDKPLAIWVDAICIDQSSILERNHQVGMMDVVYSNATATWSWLGPGSPDTDWFFETLANTPEYDDLKSPFDMEKHYPRHDMYKGSAILLGDIAAREYWTRIWIVQEMFLAKKVVLL
ncbi:heterokaryon incompatibility protein-domain-containing protein, partial [Dendryphion nanum]